jgi:hypothetical protein
MTHTLPLTLVLAAVLLGGCETTAPRHGEVVVRDRDFDVRVVFSDRDRAIIRDWYDDRRRSLPPGLAKQGKLPPGHAKRLGPRDTLPPGLAYRYLPSELERRLSRLPDGYVRVIVGGDVVLMHTRTRVVVDILHDMAVD